MHAAFGAGEDRRVRIGVKRALTISCIEVA